MTDKKLWSFLRSKKSVCYYYNKSFVELMNILEINDTKNGVQLD